MKYGYDINGNEIIIATCTTCGHEISVLKSAFLLNGMDKTVYQGFADDCNDLGLFDKVAGCCEKPNYYW